MAEKRRLQISSKKFLEENVKCCYCGDIASTIDHVPPRGIFRDRRWPEGYIFPACKKCNEDGRFSDQIATLVMRPFLFREEDDRKWRQTAESIGNNHPEVLSELKPFSRNETRKSFRETFGPQLGDQLRAKQWAAVEMGPTMLKALETFYFRLSKALFYKHAGRRNVGRSWILRLDVLAGPTIPPEVLQITPFSSSTFRSKVDLSDQFSYRFNVSPNEGALIALVQIKEQFGALLIVLDEPLAKELIDRNDRWRFTQFNEDNYIK